MSDDNRLAGIYPWPKSSLRCGIHTCRNAAEYMIRHKQGLFADKHFPLCRSCAEDILTYLPEELKALITVERVVETVNVLHLIKAVIASPEVQALSKGQDAPEEVRKALGELMDLLAQGGAEVEAPTPEGQRPLPETGYQLPENLAKMVAGGNLPTLEDKGFCPVCAKGPFKSKAALTGHMNSVHGGKKK